MKKIFYAGILILCGCASIDVPPQYVYQEIQTSVFKLASWQKITNKQSPYKIYIEGDGRAFRANGTVSSNPTPKSALLREIAFGDKHENVVYLARPCQYVQDNACQPKYWSDARFSSEVIQSAYEAIIQIAGTNPVTLVGFSGGAQVSGLVAVKNSDIQVQKLVTIAGNLDVQAWTKYHQIPSLDSSLDLHNYKYEYGHFSQVHYIGRKDDNIVPEISEKFIIDSHTIRYVNNASHNSGWEKVYDNIRQE